jgi:hypothetical protein
MTDDQLRVLDAVLDKLFAPTKTGRWLEEVGPILAKYKAEDEAELKAYTEQRDMGIKAENLTRFYDVERCEPLYRALRRVA